MTRPKDLPAALQSWANANYGAGPSWGGTAQRSAPGAAFLTPGVSLPAEVENYLHGNAFDGAQGAIVAAGQLPALNWGTAVGGGPVGNPVSIAWSDFDQAWYIIQGASTTAYRSMDYGKTWTTVTLNITTAGAPDIAFDQAGNAVIVTNGTNIQDGTYSSYGVLTWANHAAALAAYTCAGGVVAYEQANATWVLFQFASGNGMVIYTSTNRTTWTNRIIPGTWGGSVLANWTFLGVGGGILVAAFTSVTGAAGSLRTMRSSDGGITWTNDQALTVNAGINLAGGQTTLTKPTWSTVDQVWYIAANQIAGTKKVQIFSSPDAITWSTAATLLTNDVCFDGGLVAMGALLVGLCGDGRVYLSVNKGVNWFKCGNSGLSNATVFRYGGGGAAAISSVGVVPTMRFGMPLKGV